MRPKENVLPPALRDKGWEAGMGGAGTLRGSGALGSGLSSRGKSVEDGNVDEELKRADEEELSWPALEEELLVPPLPLTAVSDEVAGGGLMIYRLLKLGLLPSM